MQFIVNLVKLTAIRVRWAMCMNKSCISYKKYKSIHTNSFFKDSDCDQRLIIKVIIMYAARMPIFSIKNYLRRYIRVIERIFQRLADVITGPDYSDNKLGRFGQIVQIDETLLNYKCKSHRGRSSSNLTLYCRSNK
ncbi:hypothetical protein DMUE_4286 [Dictyocoela muelleri]|nr:hypothetical protein DMUE_4286 [Dictyocoela muelleri]